MKVKLSKPLEQYVLVDTKSGEFYTGRGETTPCLLLSKFWDSSSFAKGVRTRYYNDIIRGSYWWKQSHLKLEIKKISLSEYELS